MLEAWLALTSVKYHDNLLILMLLNQWLALTSVKYHDNLLILMLLNQWLALTSGKYHDNLLILMLLNQWLALTSVKYHDNLLILMLLNQWLALTSVKYHDNLLILMLLNQWSALTMLRTTGPRLSRLCISWCENAHTMNSRSVYDVETRNRVKFQFCEGKLREQGRLNWQANVKLNRWTGAQGKRIGRLKRRVKTRRGDRQRKLNRSREKELNPDGETP